MCVYCLEYHMMEGGCHFKEGLLFPDGDSWDDSSVCGGFDGFSVLARTTLSCHTEMIMY